jgi:hypothetical protein
MNAQKLLAGTLAGFVFLFLLDFLLYGVLLTDVLTMDATCWRPMPDWPYIIAGLLIVMFCFTYIYMKGVDPAGTKSQQGIRFGVLFGILMGFGVNLIMYSLLVNAALNDTLIDGVVTIVRFSLAGIVVAYATGLPKGTGDRGKGSDGGSGGGGV